FFKGVFVEICFTEPEQSVKHIFHSSGQAPATGEVHECPDFFQSYSNRRSVFGFSALFSRFGVDGFPGASAKKFFRTVLLSPVARQTVSSICPFSFLEDFLYLAWYLLIISCLAFMLIFVIFAPPLSGWMVQIFRGVFL
ncbi:MAG: hypothetical protein LBR71_00670, partial [Synergistaceae bacterium]|nr:hypothetical protein [Synergistaceae bacterium]